jgi:hypothetical protein
LARLGEAAWIYLSSWKMPVTLFAFIGLAAAAARSDFRPIVYGFALYFVIYGFGLFQLYAFRFGAFEVGELQSLQRYLRVPLRLGHLLGLTFLALLVASSLAGTRLDFRRYIPANSFIVFLAVAVTLAGGFQVYAIGYGLTDVRDRFSLSQKRLGVINNLQDDRRVLEQIIIERGMKKPLVAFIAQGDDGYSSRVASFLALRNKRGEGKKLYQLANGYSWGARRENAWMHKMSAPELLHKMREADIIWGHRQNPWLTAALKGMATGCKAGQAWRFLVKEAGGDRYLCIAAAPD